MAPSGRLDGLDFMDVAMKINQNTPGTRAEVSVVSVPAEYGDE